MTNPRAALLIVDLQQGFINSSTEHVISAVQGLQQHYSTRIATRFINYPASPFREIMEWHRFYPGSADIELAFSPLPGTIILDKGVYTCVDKDFLATLHQHKIEEVHICGIDTDICVTKCAVDLFENKVRPVVLADYCASHAGPDLHKCAIKILRRYIGARNIYAIPADINHPT